MPSLPPLDVNNKINHAPHVVILGAGASVAAFPKGDRRGRQLPLMQNFIEVLRLDSVLADHGIFGPIVDFEVFYSDLVESGSKVELVEKIDRNVWDYFSRMQIPDEATLYDYLLLSLREKDLIATFNWDPFLAQAYWRNRDIKALPQIVFLHGNVEVGSCNKHRTKGFLFQACSECGVQFQPSNLLYPIKRKDYAKDPLIKSEWDRLRKYLNNAYFVTVFGYSAPSADLEAKKVIVDEWLANPTMPLAQVDIVDIRARDDLEAVWKDILYKTHYSIYDNIFNTYIFRHPRRTCDAFAMATLQQAPWHENPLPLYADVSRLQQWVQPLLEEESAGSLTGSPCPAIV